MSAAVLFLQLILAVVGFLISPIGIATLLAGVVTFIAIPIIPRLTGQFRAFAHVHMTLGGGLLQRCAIVVSEHGDLLLKQMRFDDLGVEEISFNDDTKSFEDPAGALHYFFGAKFAFALEKSGVLFDPRHAALGRVKKTLDDRGEKEYRATEAEYDEYNVYEWKRGVVGFAKDAFELVPLGAVRQLVDGGERSEYPQRTEKFYEISREPYQNGTGTVKVLMIILAVVGPFSLMWFLSSQLDGTGGGGTTVGYSLASSALLLWGAPNDLDIDWESVGIAMAVLLPAPLILLIVFAVAGLVQAITVGIVFGLGLALIPLLSFPLRASNSLGGALGEQLWKMGLRGYDRPVIKWTAQKYELVEADTLDLDDQRNVSWYNLLGTVVGVTFEPGSGAWGPALEPRHELKERGEQPLAETDGGRPGPITDLPSQYVRAPEIRRAGMYAAYLPDRSTLDRDRVWVNTGIAWSEFCDSATGAKSINRLTEAKEVHGGGGGLDDKTLVYATLGAGMFSFIAGIIIFFLL